MEKQYELDGMLFKIILSGEQTQGKYSLIEILFPQKEGEGAVGGGAEDIGEEHKMKIPLHIQIRETVIVYVLEGSFQIKYGEKNLNCEQGMLLKLEKNIARSFERIGKEIGRLLVLYIPAGFEEFFKDVGSINISHFKKLGNDEPILIQLLEKTYGARMIYE